jgi:membrane protein DedA with SNARE-associated domain
MFVNEWVLASRIRFAVVQTAISGVVVLGLGAFFNGLDSLRNNLWLISVALVLASVVNAWVWYPRAKSRFTASRG